MFSNLKGRIKYNSRSFLTLILLGMFIYSLFYVDLGNGVLHKGGATTAKSMFVSFFRPEFSKDIIFLAIKSSWQTFAYSVISISIAVLVAFILSIFSSGVLFKSKIIQVSTTAFIGFLRSVNELIWAWLFVAAVGLNPLGAIFALAIPYSGYLGKIFADTFMEADQKPLQALRISGANKWQVFFYGYLPQSLPNMLSYTMYRLECAIRSSTVLSFIGLGGIGFQIQISLQDLKYEQVWVFLAFLIGMVWIVDYCSNLIREEVLNKNNRKNIVKISFYIFGILTLASWWYILRYNPKIFSDLFNEKNAFYLNKFLKGLLGTGEELPAFLNIKMWEMALKLSYETFVMSILATGVAAIGMFIFVLPAAKSVGDSNYIAERSLFSKFTFFISQVIFVVARSIPELMWALILIFILKPGILPGAIALAIHNMGVLGKLCSEVIEDLNEKPVRNLNQSGANKVQTMFYGIIPEVLPKFLNYILYRMENIIRATLIVGFVGASGLGMQFKLAMSFFKYSEITLYLLCYVILVYVTDIISYFAKKAIR